MPEQKRILIVDDDPDIHHLLKAALREDGREIGSAFDGLEGLELVEQEPWDLVITDVVMPKMDGMALLERIHKVRPATRVVVMTVANTAENIVTAIRDHAFAWFGKPFTIEAVREMVERALTSNTADDDIQVLSASPQWLGLKLRCKLETAARIVQFLREMEKGLAANEKENVATAFREILLNAIEHGGGNDPEKSVIITHVRSAKALLYYVRDPGQGFSFSELKHAAVSNSLESPMEHIETRQQLGMRAGGFGILMTRSLVDDLIYNETGNEVLLIKYLK
jgi:CheY-like chemotaxis protein/anti-sigma regulatory factor (Ser/Thr protein kinase)